MLTMFSAFAEFERDLMREHQREGIANAKASRAGNDTSGAAPRCLVQAFAGVD
jgi:DNA invertase Pin-like site-specific DNA recombinase